MPLDAADFIAELDITSPPGTDPLNQGDDQIRTAKRTQLNSFPLIGGAVSIDHNQMNQMAIKNEVNTFTTDQIISEASLSISNATQTANIFFVQGGAVDWSVQNNTNSEFAIRRFVGGVSTDSPFKIEPANGRATFSGIAFFDAEVRAFAGSAAFPAFTFQGNETTGMYNSASNVLNFSTAGADRIALTASEMNIKSSQVWMGDGTAAAPSYSFVGSQNMGIFRQFATSMGFAVGGTQAFAMLVNQLRSISNGSAATPAYSFNSGSGDMGMYRLTGDQLAFVVQQVTRFIIKGNTFTMVNLPTGPGGLLVTGDLYAKQSQLFAGTELVMGVQP